LKNITQTAWHTLPAQEAAELLETAPSTGLAQVEIEARVRRFGANRMTVRKRRGEWIRFFLQFHQPLL